MRRRLPRFLLIGIAFSAAVFFSGLKPQGTSEAQETPTPIQHVIMIMQENRSFDEYFGTFPGADGIPPGTCVPDPLHGDCQAPYHDSDLVDKGARHGPGAFKDDFDKGKMDGFVAVAEKGGNKNPDVMGYHDGSDIPNYWAYAQNFVLQDHMFAPEKSWSGPAHLFMVSGWSAECPKATDPFSCKNWLNGTSPGGPGGQHEYFAWTDLTYLLHQYGISWRYYISTGQQPDCDDGAVTCPAKTQ